MKAEAEEMQADAEVITALELLPRSGNSERSSVHSNEIGTLHSSMQDSDLQYELLVSQQDLFCLRLNGAPDFSIKAVPRGHLKREAASPRTERMECASSGLSILCSEAAAVGVHGAKSTNQRCVPATSGSSMSTTPGTVFQAQHSADLAAKLQARLRHSAAEKPMVELDVVPAKLFTASIQPFEASESWRVVDPPIAWSDPLVDRPPDAGPTNDKSNIQNWLHQTKPKEITRARKRRVEAQLDRFTIGGPGLDKLADTSSSYVAILASLDSVKCGTGQAACGAILTSDFASSTSCYCRRLQEHTLASGIKVRSRSLTTGVEFARCTPVAAATLHRVLKLLLNVYSVPGVSTVVALLRCPCGADFSLNSEVQDQTCTQNTQHKSTTSPDANRDKAHRSRWRYSRVLTSLRIQLSELTSLSTSMQYRITILFNRRADQFEYPSDHDGAKGIKAYTDIECPDRASDPRQSPAMPVVNGRHRLHLPSDCILELGTACHGGVRTDSNPSLGLDEHIRTTQQHGTLQIDLNRIPDSIEPE
jgi:hypothetical protein